MSWTTKPSYEPAPPVHLNPWYSEVAEEQRDQKHSSVYLLELNDAYKIGYTRQSVDDRVSGLQTGTPDRIAVVAVRAGGPPLERAIHRRLERYRKSGEWFDKCDAVLTAFYSTELDGPSEAASSAHPQPVEAHMPLLEGIA